jgi:hypothetical protein
MRMQGPYSMVSRNEYRRIVMWIRSAHQRAKGQLLQLYATVIASEAKQSRPQSKTGLLRRLRASQ